MRHVCRTLFSALLYLVTIAAQATPVAYNLKFIVDYIPERGQVDERVQIGNIYFGSFVINDAVLASDGINKLGGLTAFRIQMEDQIWDFNSPLPVSEFVGFRGPTGLGASSPGFDVSGEQIVNLRGGVFGVTDDPFIDFSYDPRLPLGDPHACATGTTYCGNAANRFWTINGLGDFGGSILVFAVPEPSALALMGMGLLGVVLVFGRRKQHTSNRQRIRNTP